MVASAPVLCVTVVTIVLNGEPFLRHHLPEFERLGTALDARYGNASSTPRRGCQGGQWWQWHIAEGLATGQADHRRPYTAEEIPAVFHDQGLSVDGTTAFIDDLARRHANIHVHRNCDADSGGCAWRDKRQMLNRVMAAVDEPETLLLQVDADELWTTSQLLGIVDLFDEGEKLCAYFDAHFFLGPNLVAVTPGAYGHSYEYEWLRAWRLTRQHRAWHWFSHAPPVLLALTPEGWEPLTGRPVPACTYAGDLS
jgi:hypothetical protein